MAGLPFACEWLDASSSPTDQNAAIAAIAAFDPQVVVVDQYGITAPWHEAVRARFSCLVAAVDDLADRPLAPDVLIDHNFHPDPVAKYRDVIPEGVRLLAGPRFALLGSAYAQGARYRFSEDVRSIGIFMGGTDLVDACSAALRGCREVADFAGPIEIVSSCMSPHIDALKALCARTPGATLAVDLPDLAAFFARHDLHIGAGGGGTWERCCVGAPTIACLVADNQMATLPHLEAIGVLAWANPGGSLASADLREGIGSCVAALVRDPGRRRELASRGAQLVDGKGAARIAAVLACAAERTLRMRPAGAEDEDLLLDWANDPVVRANAFQPQLIPPQQHAVWFRAKLTQSAQCRIFVGQAGNGIPAGQVRFDWRADQRGDHWEISYSVDTAFRGLGLARPLLCGALDSLRRDAIPARVVGRVKPDNKSSARVLRALGFSEAAAFDERGHFTLFTLEFAEARQ